MQISYIITINPIIEFRYLNALIHSLNLQTSGQFDVVFYNQINESEQELFAKLDVLPQFPYTFFSVEKDMFFNNYPVWDLYGFHQFLLDNDLVGDYFMSLHMEEFLDYDYTAKAAAVLEKNGFDILLGNLSRTQYVYDDIAAIIETADREAFDQYLKKTGIKDAFHWCFTTKNMIFNRNWRRARSNYRLRKAFGGSRQVKPTAEGFFRLPNYIAEDLLFMSKTFAHKYRWYDAPVKMYFSDIHISSRLEDTVKSITDFPVYFNQAKVYHLDHGRYFYQIEDEGFGREFLKYETDSKILLALQAAISQKQQQGLTDREALDIFRGKHDAEGYQDINYEFHVNNVRQALAVGEEES